MDSGIADAGRLGLRGPAQPREGGTASSRDSRSERDGAPVRMPWQRNSLSARSALGSTIGEQIFQVPGDDPPDPDWSRPRHGSGTFVPWIPRYERSPDRLWAVLEWRAHAIPVADVAALVDVPEAKVWSWLRGLARATRNERIRLAVRPRAEGGETV